MGIKKLKSLIERYSPNAIKIKPLSFYKNKVIAIDTSIYLYKYKYKFSESNIINGFIEQIIILLKNGIVPVYVFDGKPPIEKSNILNKRKIRRDNIKKRIDELNEDDYKNNDEELEMLHKNLIIITKDDIDKCKELFDVFGIKYVTATGEAEVLCSHLCKMKIAFGCLTEDTDILANGCNIFIRNFSYYSKTITEYCLSDILIGMDMTLTEFIDMCILCGCDNSPKIKGIGTITAYKLIKKNQNIENIIKNIENKQKGYTRYIIPPDFNYVKARELFNTKPPTVPEELKNIKINPKSIDDIIKFCDNNEIYDNHIRINITKLKIFKTKPKVKPITCYFTL